MGLIARPIVAVIAWWYAALHGWWIVSLAAVPIVYGGSLTAVHHLIHSSLGLRPRARRFWLSALGSLVVESGHALQVTHLAHHRGDPDWPDPEGYIENVSWRELPWAALIFRYRLAWWGFTRGPRRGRVGAELVIHAAAHLASLALLPVTVLPWCYLTLIHLASFTFAALAGKGPQTNYGRPITSPLVMVHTALGRILFFSHDRHLEHHLYPKVPLPRLRLLRAEVDAALEGRDVVDVTMPV